MKKVLWFSVLLVAGLVGSQLVPGLLGAAAEGFSHVVLVLTMIALSFVMIHVRYEFEIDRNRLGQYGWDYVVAFTAACFLWILLPSFFLWRVPPSFPFFLLSRRAATA